MKVLQLISSAGQFGAENVILELSLALRQQGHDLVVGCFLNKHTPNADLIGAVKEHELPVVIFECAGKVDVKTIFRIASYVREHKVDVIHSHGYKANIYTYLANLIARKSLVSTCHNWIDSSGKMSLYSFLDKRFIKRFDFVVAVSQPVKQALLAAGIAEKNIRLISNGINVEKFTVCGASDLLCEVPADVTRIGCIGRLSEEKGLHYFLKAAQSLLNQSKKLCFIIVGDGPLKASLIKEAEQLGISGNVIFMGRREDIPEVLSSLDIFMMPSLTEGQPLALLEAMAAGKPIIASGVGDIPKILKDGQLGIITPPADSIRLVEAVQHYISHPDNAKKMSKDAKEEVVNYYSSERMAQEYGKIYIST